MESWLEIMEKTIFDLVKNYNHAPIKYPNINFLKIPVTILKPNLENAELFNSILSLLRADKSLHGIVRTKSGGISTSIKDLLLPAWDYVTTVASAEITILDKLGMWRIQFRAGIYEDDNKTMSGREAFQKFKDILKKFKINLDDYAIENGLEVKQEIEKPLIKMENPAFKDCIFYNVHHIDFHNSYPGGLANTHPEFREPIEFCYKKRHDDPVYKAVLNFSVGFMQSKWCGYRFAHLSKDAIGDNNARVRQVASDLVKNNRILLSYNTDGIWYKGEVYHGALEGSEIGQWENDHINCQFRMKSDGAYEFIEDGKYHPVVRGFTKLDYIKDRSKWKWGDIYQAEIITFYINKNGIQYKEGTVWEDQ